VECGYVDGITREVIIIDLCLSNVNREDGVLSVVFYTLKEWRKLSYEDTQLRHYSPFQDQQMMALLPLHVLHLTVFLLSFSFCCILAVFLSGVF
jgi:hypothetical protein